MKKHLMTLGGLAGAGFVQAHEGHGLPGLSHWHAGDLAVLLVLAVVLALALVLGLGLGLGRRLFARQSGPR